MSGKAVLFTMLLVCGPTERASAQATTHSSAENPASMKMTFLSDTDPAYAYLEAVQEAAYADDPTAFRWTNLPSQRQQLEDLMKQLGSADLLDSVLAKLNRSIPTRFEEPNTLIMLDDAVKLVEQTIGESLSVAKRPRRGTLPASTLNARTILVPRTESQLVVLNGLIFQFPYEYLKAGLKTVSIKEDGKTVEMSYDKEAFEDGPRQDVELRVRMSKILEDEVNHRRIRSQGIASESERPLLIPLVTAMEFFVVAHEYGHIVLGHVSKDRSEELISGGQSVRTILRTWGQEAAADEYACALLDRYLSGKAAEPEADHAGVNLREYMRLAPLFFFAFDSAAQDAQFVFANKATPVRLTAQEREQLISRLRETVHQVSDVTQGTKVGGAGGSAVVAQALKNAYPPAWARMALVQDYQHSHPFPSGDSTDQAFRDLGRAMLENIQVMEADLMPEWVAILQGPSSQE